MNNLKENLKDGWEEYRFNDVFELKQGQYIEPSSFVTKGYDIYGANGIIGKTKNYMFDNEVVLVSCRGANCGVVHFTKPQSWVNNNSIALIPKRKDIEPKFIYYSSVNSGFNGFITGSAQPQIVINVLGLKKILLPSITIQKKIAEILSKVDEDIEKTDDVIKKTKGLKKGLMQDLLTKGIGHKKFKKTKLGMIPEEWRMQELKEMGIFSKGKGIPKKDLVLNGLSAICYGEIYTKHQFIVKKIYSFISMELASESISIKKGDILFTGSGETPEEIGKSVTYLGDNKVYAGGDIIIFSPNEDDSIFLSYLFNSSLVRKELTRLAQGNSVVHIYKGLLEKIKVALPSIGEQKEIANILSKVDEKIEIYQKTKSKLETLKKGLMQDLLSERVRA